MKRPWAGRVKVALLLLTWGIGTSLDAEESTWPDASDPVAGLGVNIHFTDPKPGELEMLSRAGFHWVRTDFSWESTEKKARVYDFAAYDRLLASLDKSNLHALFILDYKNLLYDQGLPSHTDQGRQAFARWAAAAVIHFKGKGVLWEIWNEPNGDSFWKPSPNADDYAKLALTVSQAIKKVAPDERVVGPALSGGDIDFIEPTAKAGVLNDWLGITIHPYYSSCPESYGGAYDRTRELIEKYTSPAQNLSVMCGESGYSTAWSGIDEQTQGKYIARLCLFDVMSGVTLTIWYDWHNDGVNPKEPEHNFGIVRHDYHAGREDVYDRKPAYDAVRTYSSQLAGLKLKERLWTESKKDFVLSFSNRDEECLVAWTADHSPHEVTLLVPNGTYRVTSYDGKKPSSLQVTRGTLHLLLDDAPQYLARRDLPQP